MHALLFGPRWQVLCLWLALLPECSRPAWWLVLAYCEAVLVLVYIWHFTWFDGLVDGPYTSALITCLL